MASYQIFVKHLDGTTLCLHLPSPAISGEALKDSLSLRCCLPLRSLRLVSGTREVSDQTVVSADSGHVFPSLSLLPRLVGGKGGFGSLLRGAASKAGQKKTSNFDACRDMSGRRLRHVNAEKRLEEWKAEAEERRLEKLAEDFLKKKAKEGKKSSDLEVEKYLEKYRKDTERCVGEVEESVKESFRLYKESKRKVLSASGSSSSKKLKIWMGKKKVEDSDSDSDTDEDEEKSNEDSKSIIIDEGNGMFRVCLISAFSSALFTNDTVCVVLTEFILKIARQNDLPAQPFLLALASSANIGSAATPIGNPQNLVIAVQSGISFGRFLKGLLGAMIVGVLVNACILLVYFWKILSVEKKDIEVASTVPSEVVADDEVISHRFSPATMSHFTSLGSQELEAAVEAVIQTSTSASLGGIGDISFRSRRYNSEGEIQTASPDSKEARTDGVVHTCPSIVSVEVTASRRIVRSLSSRQREVLRDDLSIEDKEVLGERWKRICWKVSVYLVTLGMLVALLMGLNMSWTALTAALVLVVIDFKDARPCLEKVSYSLLIFFCGMFITVDGFNKTGIPSALWDFVEPYSKINSAGGVALFFFGGSCSLKHCLKCANSPAAWSESGSISS